ncbi:hypothetical protein BCR39DRAFT_558256 [Naematelia encephala]|uniref:Ribosomal protein S15 n=1 Tax=Naematelia encephala TaxID=71784 RepID=A0A1Y2B9S3_9TREE|nr:hypothetical protein BCR39DRAFT_558256 [Naematelia encephala]
MSRTLPSLSALKCSLPRLAPQPIASSSSSSRPFHSTSPSYASRATKEAARKRRNANMDLQDRLHASSAGLADPILGFVNPSITETKRRVPLPDGPTGWDGCKLSKIIIHPSTIHNLPPPNYQLGETPQFLRPDLTRQDRQLLFGATPNVTAALKATTPETMEQVVKDQEKQSEMMLRIMDLRHASRSLIASFNKKRVIAEFGGAHGTNTGDSVVIAALLTLKIRSLNEHVISNRKDIFNARALRLLTSKRAKVLRYLRRKEPKRYYQTLEDLGLDPRAVEGELIIRTKY